MFPKYQEIQLPLLAELKKRGGKSRPSERNAEGKTLYDTLADIFDLSADLRLVNIFEKDGTPRSKWENMVRWARNDLRKSGCLISPNRGIWEITDSGKEMLEENNDEKIGESVFVPELFVSPEKFNSLKAKAEEIGRLGESYVYEREKQKLFNCGKIDLANKVKMISHENVAAGYDVLSFDADGQEKYIEVKTTVGTGGSFEFTSNELAVAKKLRDNYWIYRVTRIRSKSPEIQEIQNPAKLIELHMLILKPTSFTVMKSENYDG